MTDPRHVPMLDPGWYAGAVIEEIRTSIAGYQADERAFRMDEVLVVSADLSDDTYPATQVILEVRRARSGRSATFRYELWSHMGEYPFLDSVAQQAANLHLAAREDGERL